MSARQPIQLDEQQVLYFRARRGLLAGPGAPHPAAAARAILGAQAQQPRPALAALSLRTRHRPGAAEVERHLLQAPRTLVRTWGQRDTLHLYHPEDWATVVAARPEWGQTGRRGLMPPAAAVASAAQRLAEGGGALTRSDLLDLVSEEYVRRWQERAGSAREARRWAAGRLIWRLAQRGEVCVGGKVGAEQAYPARRSWFPELAWPRRPESSKAAATRLARRYLGLYGPATAQDLAHFFGAPVPNARAWLKALDSELAPARCGGREDLVALEEDLEELRAAPPAGFRAWPLRLLPTWDTLLMGHADKSWTAPVAAERPKIWRRAAFVAAAVLVRGRVVATWSHEAKRSGLSVRIEPLSGWRAAYRAGARREARALAAHLELPDARVTVAR